MSDNVLLGIGRLTVPIPPFVWRRQVAGDAEGHSTHLAFMTPDHHRVRNFVVLEIARCARPLAPEYVAEQLDLPLSQVKAILDDLEHHMTFLFRNPQGEVVWAYPVTAAQTPHRVTFATGERLYAA